MLISNLTLCSAVNQNRSFFGERLAGSSRQCVQQGKLAMRFAIELAIELTVCGGARNEICNGARAETHNRTRNEVRIF